jgi:hypothetical protein
MAVSHTSSVLDALHGWYGNDFNEALNKSLSRVMQHAKERSIGIISSDRKGQTDDERSLARRSLISDIKKSGFGYTHVLGVGQEEGGPSSEKSFLVVSHKGDDKGHLKKSLTNLGRKYGQMGIMHKQHGDPNAKFVHTSHEHLGKEEDLGTFHANDSAALFHTKLKGKRQFSYSNDKKERIDVVYLEPRGFFVRRDYFAT